VIVVQPIIKHIEGVGGRQPDVYQPKSPSHFGIILYLFIGPEDGPCEELFQILVCSPSWFEKHEMAIPFRSGHAYLFAKSWDWLSVEAYLREYVASFESESWVKCGLRLARVFDWEMARVAIDRFPSST
jgi:hypothetical protein